MQGLQISVPGAILINGKARDGKSHLAQHLLNATKQHIDYFIAFSNTAFNPENFPFAPPEFLHMGYKPEVMKELLDLQERTKDKGTVGCVMIDDCTGDTKIWNCKYLQLAMTAFYHYRLLVIICIHHVNKLPPLLRENASQVAIFALDTHRALSAAYDSYGQEFETLKDFKKFVYTSLDQRYNFLWKDKDGRDGTPGWTITRCPAELPTFYLDYNSNRTIYHDKPSSSNKFWQKETSDMQSDEEEGEERNQ